MEPSIKSQIAVVSMTIVFLSFVGGLDYATGPELGFFAFYFLPISIATWYLARKSVVTSSSLAAISIWFVVEQLNGRAYSSSFIKYWDAGIKFVAFLILGFAVLRVKHALQQEKESNEKLSTALAEVKNLTGLLPICASCKQIRDDEGYWHRVEAYISNHSDAEFTHSMCPACSKEWYPHFKAKVRQSVV